MKRNLTKLMAALALLVTLAIPMGMWGQSDYSSDYTGNVTLSTTGGTSASACVINISGNQYNGIKAGTGSNAGAVVITVPSGTKYLHIHAAAWNNTNCSLAVTPTGYSGAIALTANSGIANNSPFTFNGNANTSDYYKVITFSSALTSNTNLTFTATGGKRFVIWGVTSEEEGTPAAVATPTFSPVGGTYAVPQSVTITCETQGTTIYYTTDGSEPDDESTQYTTPIAVNESMTIKAIAYDGDDNASSIASAAYTILTPLTIAQARAQGNGSVLTSGTVTSCVGTTGYIQDATAAICVYGASLTVGDEISVSGTLSTFNGLLEITNPQVTVISSGNTVTPEVMSIADINASENQGWYVRIEEATVSAISDKNVTIAQGENTVVVRFASTDDITFEEDDVISLNGNIGAFNGVQIANPQNVTIQENENPSISAEDVNIAYNATSGEITYTIENGVSGGALTAATESDWLTLPSTYASPIQFTCTANSASTARTATVVLTYTYNRTTVTKNVTVTQAAYEAPSYTWDLTTNSYASASEDQVTWTCNYATMVIDKANATTNANNYLGGTSGRTSTRFYKDSELTIAPATGYAITSVVFTATTENFANAFAGSTWTNATAVVNGTTVTITPTDGTADIFAVIGGTCGFSGATVYYVENNAPSITASDVDITYDATSGSIGYTINNGVTGGTLTAAITDSNIANFALGTVGSASVPFTCDANSTNAARTATVTLTYTYGRSTVSKAVVVTQAAAPNAINVISDITATGSYTVQGTIVAMSNRGFIVGDGTGYVYYYEGANFSTELGINDIVKLSGNVTTYNHVYQFPANSYEAANSSNYNGTPAVQILDATAIGTYSSNNHLSNYVQIEGTLVKDGNYYNIQVEGLQTDASISFPTGAQADALTALNNKTVIVKGYFAGVSGGHFSVIMESVEEVVVTEPSVTVTPNTINAPAAGANGSLAITYENIPDLISFDYYFCDATGVEILDSDPNYPTWIDAEIQDENDVYSVDYEIAANTGEARTAYFKVYTTDTPDNEEAFAIVTVNQAAYVPAPAGDEFVRITNLNQLTNGSLVVIASRYDETATNYRAMKNTISNGKASSVAFESTTSGNNEVLPATIADNVDDYYWVVSVNNGVYTFTNASGGVIGYGSSTNFNMNGNNTTWTIARATSGASLVPYYEGFTIQNVEEEDRYIAYRNTEVFGPYSSQNINGDTYNFYLDFFVQVAPETHYLDIIGYESTNNDPVDWHLIASPVNVDPATTGMIDEVYDLYYFDEGASDGMEWINYRDANFDLVPGKGYLYAHDEDVTLTFTGTPYDGTPITLQKTENANWSGWNLVGNPYGETTAYITDGRDFYVMKADGSEIIESEINGILPMQGIFVIAAEDGEQLTFTTTAPTTTGEKLVVNVSDTRHSVIDRAMVRFGEGRTLPKFMFNGDHTKLYIAQGNEEFAVVRSINENSTPVSFRAAVNGTYTLSVTAEEVEMEYLHLIDNLTGADVDLLATPSYTFEANTTDIAQRFTLVYATVDGISENTANGFAFFNGTNWTVSNEGDATLQVVDVMGRILSTQNVNGNATITLDQPTGVYMLRLVNGDNVKVQKVVVR